MVAHSLVGYLVGYKATNQFSTWNPPKRTVTQRWDATFGENIRYDLGAKILIVKAVLRPSLAGVVFETSRELYQTVGLVEQDQRMSKATHPPWSTVWMAIRNKTAVRPSKVTLSCDLMNTSCSNKLTARTANGSLWCSDISSSYLLADVRICDDEMPRKDSKAYSLRRLVIFKEEFSIPNYRYIYTSYPDASVSWRVFALYFARSVPLANVWLHAVTYSLLVQA